MARRTVLFAPGDEPAKCENAAASGADVVVFDLEDGVGPGRRDEARETVRALLAEVESDAELCVRVTAGPESWEADLAVALAETAPDSILVPKVDGPSDVTALASALEERGKSVPLLAMIESAAGVLAAADVADRAPVDALVYGAEDLAADLGGDPSGVATSGGYAREHVLIAARAAGVDAIDTHYPAYEDSEGLRETAERAAALGYDGKLAIHPDQLAVIRDAFVPSSERVAWAERVLAADRDAAGGVTVVDGEMIDAPQVRQAERILDRAGER